MARIYLSPPDVGGEERRLLVEAFDSGWISPLGPYIDEFEQAMCRYTGARHAAALSSGTAALHLALRILGIKPGDEVLTSTLTFAATANAIRYLGATPVFVDADEATWNMDPDRLAEAIESRPRPPAAIVVVDLYGQCADYDRILAVADARGVPVVEDAAEALGATYRNRAAGTFGRLGVFSFNGNKILTTSGGGMLVSDDEGAIRRARYLATQARQPVLHYEHEEVGYNYRLSNLLAAVGVAQLRSLDDRVARRRAVFDRYRRELGALPGVRFMPEADYGRATRWLSCLTVDAEALGDTRDAIIERLQSQEIEARPVWKPMHLQPAHRDCPAVGGEVSERLFRTGLCLPSGSNLTDADLDRVIASFRGSS